MRDDWAELGRRRWVIGLAVLALLALVFWREPISQRLVPDPRMNRQLERAQAALTQGKLSAADGSGARELFESVLATDPDQMAARQGLAAVRDAAIDRARRALVAHRLGQARESLALADALSAPAVQMQALRARLHDLEQASNNTSALLAQATAPGVKDEDALLLFNRVLLVDADNAQALAGRGALFGRWLGRAEALLAGNRVEEARQLVARVVADDPGHLDLPPVQATLGEALSRLQAEQRRALASAQAQERAGRPDHAAGLLLQLQREHSDIDGLREAMERLATRLTARAQRQAADFQFRRAESSLQLARQLDPDNADIQVATQRLGQSRLAQKRLLKTPARGEKERLPALLLEAEQALARGDFITPPGTSAWDKLRVAAAIAPRSPELARLQKDFGQRSHACFEQAMTDNQLRRAQACLDASLTLDPASARAREARRRLADRWLAYAEERIGASDYAEAERALALASGLQPAHPKLKATQARLRRARGASR